MKITNKKIIHEHAVVQSYSSPIMEAEHEMERMLARAYPTGCTIHCHLQHGQINPSVGIVISHPGGRNAYVRVRFDTRAKLVRDVPATNIFAHTNAKGDWI